VSHTHEIVTSTVLEEYQTADFPNVPRVPIEWVLAIWAG